MQLSSKVSVIFGLVLTSLFVACAHVPTDNPSQSVSRTLASEGWESYLDRPDILDVAPKTLAEAPLEWNALRRAHIEAVAFFIEMYPDRELYFLARDSELLYDLARLALKDKPERLSKIHLLNISRANMRADHVKEYLAQEGISENALEQGKKILLVDTGFSGTISQVIKTYFSGKHHPQIKTHLLVSNNPEHPSLRTFLMWLNSAVVEMAPGSMHGSIVSYEHMPRFTGRSTRFDFFNGRWHPMSQKIKSLHDDGGVSQDLAIKYMADLKYYFETAESQEIFIQRRKFWRTLKSLPAEDMSEFLRQSYARAAPGKEKTLIQASVLDLHNIGFDSIPLKDFGIKNSIHEMIPNLGVAKFELIKKFPEWTTILENPETEIAKLFDKGDLATLGKLIDTVDDQEFQILIKKQAAQKASPASRGVVDIYISKKDPKILQELFLRVFSVQEENVFQEQIDKFVNVAVELKQSNLLRDFTAKVLSRPYESEMQKTVVYMTQEAVKSHDYQLMKALVHFVYSQPQVSVSDHIFLDLCRKLVDQKDPDSWSYLIESILFKKRFPNRELVLKDIIRLSREIKSRQALRTLAQNDKKLKYLIKSDEIFRLYLEAIFELKDSYSLKWVLHSLGHEPHSQRSNYIKTFIEVIQLGEESEVTELVKEIHGEPGNDDLKEALKGISPSGTKGVGKNETVIGKIPIIYTDKTKKEVGLYSAPKEEVRELDGRKFKVLSFVDSGKRGKVYQVQDIATGELYALKVAIDSSPDTLSSFAKEAEKADLYKKYGVSHAEIIALSDTQILKRWVDGTRGDQFFKEWELKGASLDSAPLIALKSWIQSLASKGIYIGDLNAKNIIWNGKEWIVVDSGSIKEALGNDVALGEYLDKIPKKAAKRLSPGCAQIFEQFLNQ